ncbi:hypothetical protein [Kitasatospora sp. NPDC057015]|uniref:hypothetical protein n=1 Tax=Kitasatospora sp. NPDC057015 TaxID=3346001 RepID=UPI00363FA586
MTHEPPQPSESASTRTDPLNDAALRGDCLALLAEHGLESTPKSSCLGCPFHGNQQWREIRDGDPEGWADVVEFDALIRAGNARATESGNPLLGQAYLHRSRVPLSQAPIDRLTRREQLALDEQQAADEAEFGPADGCSPYSCRSGDPVA